MCEKVNGGAGGGHKGGDAYPNSNQKAGCCGHNWIAG